MEWIVAIPEPPDATASSIRRWLTAVVRTGSVKAWAVVVAYLVVVKFLSITLVPIGFRSGGQEALFSWQTLAVYSVLGLIGVVLALYTGFPDALDPRVSNRWRVALPVLTGFGIALLAVPLDLVTGGTAAVSRAIHQPSFNIDFPGSLLAYSAGGILVDIEYRLFTVPLLLWLISNVLLRGRGQTQTFWVLAAISTLFEPVLQGVGLSIMAAGVVTPLMLGAYMLTAIPQNFAQVFFFRRAGFIASILVRQAYYLVWHIAYGNFLYPALTGQP
jgi:hypothetical protein